MDFRIVADDATDTEILRLLIPARAELLRKDAGPALPTGRTLAAATVSDLRMAAGVCADARRHLRTAPRILDGSGREVSEDAWRPVLAAGRGSAIR